MNAAPTSPASHPRQATPPHSHLPFTSFHFIFPTHQLHEVLAGEATRGLWIRGWGVVLLVGGQLDSLLVHPLGLHPLDETEEVLIRHCRGVLARFRWGAALVVDPGRLRQREKIGIKDVEEDLRLTEYLAENICLLDEDKDTDLALDEHVEEVVAGFLVISLAHQVAQVVVGDPQTREAPDVDALVIQAAALGAGNQVKQLLRLRGGGDGRI